MSVILFGLGILLTAAGIVLVGFAIPINDMGLFNTLILAGTCGLVGGLLLVGQSAVVAELHKAVELLKVRAAARPARIEAAPATSETVAREISPTVAREPQAASEPQPAAPPVEVSTNAIERLRSSISRSDKVPVAEEVPLSPNGQQPHPAEPPVEVAPRPAAAGAAVETVREPRLDFLFRPRTPRPPQQPAQEFDTMWPKRQARDAQPDPRLEVARAPAAVPAPNAAAVAPAADVRPQPQPAAPPPEQPVEEERTVAILKSGVVDGMAYTLYADGSIEAQLPQGTVRFGSIAELRAHIENNANA